MAFFHPADNFYFNQQFERRIKKKLIFLKKRKSDLLLRVLISRLLRRVKDSLKLFIEPYCSILRPQEFFYSLIQAPQTLTYQVCETLERKYRSRLEVFQMTNPCRKIIELQKIRLDNSQRKQESLNLNTCLGSKNNHQQKGSGICEVKRINRIIKVKEREMVSYALNLENELNRGRGRIEVILGPMFSGKTTELMRRLRRYQLARFSCLVIKYEGDTRYSKTDIATHDLRTFGAVSCAVLKEYKGKALDYEVIGIDEGQFFPDLIDFCETLANLGKVVVIAALDGTYQRTAFGDILNLVPLAESIIKLNAICMICYNNASFTKRISKEKAVEVIGGTDKYMAVCRECYNLAENDAKRPALIPLYENN